MIARTSALVALLALSGCGESSGDAAPLASTAKLFTGYFFDTGVKGLRYRSCAAQGYTGPHGEFAYAQVAECSVTFCLGTSCLDTFRLTGPTGDTLTSGIITPYDLASDAQVRGNFLRTLRAFDADGDASNGIEISEAVDHLLEQRTIDWSSADLAAALRDTLLEASRLDGTSHVLPDAQTAEDAFLDAMRCLSSGLYRGTWNLASGASASPSTRQGTVALLIAPVSSHASGVLLESVDNGADPRYCPSGTGCRFFPQFDSVSVLPWTLADSLEIEPILTDSNRVLSGRLSYNYYVVGADSSTSEQALFTLLPPLERNPAALMHFAGVTATRYALELQVLSDNHVSAVVFDLASPFLDPVANTVVPDALALLSGTLQGDTVHAHGMTTSTGVIQQSYDLDGAVYRASMTFQGTVTETGGTTPRARFDSLYPAYGCTL